MLRPMRTGSGHRGSLGRSLLCAVIVAIVAPVAARPALGADEPDGPAHWDYRTIYVIWDEAARDWRADWTDGPSTVGLEAVLDAEGAVGWELVGMAPERFDTVTGQQTTQQLRLVFKRPLDEGDGPGPPVVPALESSVSIRGFAFQPASIAVAIGTTVTWQNQDGVPHTATSGAGAFNTGTIEAGGSSGVTFDEPGTFDYVCAIHPQMSGTIVVS